MSPSSPVVSVVVPVFNKGRYLHEALASLEQQGVRDLEVLIVNDGSTDDSAIEIARASQSFPHLGIRSFEKTNGGASDARNFAVSRARSSILLNMDADDIMQPHFLRQAIEIAQRDEADVIYSDLELFGERSGEWIPAPFDPYYIRYDNCVPALAMYRRSFWEKAGGYDISLPFSEDWHFFVKMTKAGARFRKISGKYFRYRQTDTGLYHNFIRDAWEWGAPMIITAQSDLYAVEEVVWACQKLGSMPERWQKKFANQDKLHPNQWLLKFWLGLYREAQGDALGAVELFQHSVKASQFTEWLPLFKLAQLVESIDSNLSIQAYHQVRILRPDMRRFVNERIDTLAKSNGSIGAV